MIDLNEIIKKYNLPKYPNHLVLNTTNNCNLACRYCFESHSPESMSFDIAKRAIDLIVKYRNINIEEGKFDSKHTNNLTFFGGEPMLKFNDIIKPCIEYINEKYPNIFDFSMTTNLTLLNEQNTDFLFNNNFNLLFSFDGMKEIQNKNRYFKNKSNSYDICFNNLKYIIKNYDNNNKYNWAIRATIPFDQLELFYDNYQFFDNLGNFNFFWGLDVTDNWDESLNNVLEEQQLKFFIIDYINIYRIFYL